MNKAVRSKLFLMMVLEFFIWGAWLPLIFGYLPSLGFSPGQQAWILNAFPVAAIIGMFFSNQFADRNFAAEKFLGFSQLIGGLAMVGLAFTNTFWPFFGLMLVHCLLYVPTLSVTNSIAFANLKDAKDFGLVRMGGTIGWMLAAWPFTFILVDWDKVNAAIPRAGELARNRVGSGLTGDPLKRATRWTYVVAGIGSLALAALSFVLPHTPPKKAESAENKLAWIEALRLLAKPFVLVLWIVTFVDSFVLNAISTGRQLFWAVRRWASRAIWIMPVMSIGQIAEILTMFMLAATLKRLGWRATMIVGILGHVARFAVFAFFPQITALIVLVFILHGICYAFFFATVYIFVDEYFPQGRPGQRPGFVQRHDSRPGRDGANSLCPYLTKNFMQGDMIDFRHLFLVPCGVAAAAALTLALFFHPPKTGADQTVHP